MLYVCAYVSIYIYLYVYVHIYMYIKSAGLWACIVFCDVEIRLRTSLVCGDELCVILLYVYISSRASMSHMSPNTAVCHAVSSSKTKSRER